MTLRSALVAIVGLLPASRLKNAAFRRMGWTIGRNVQFGPCLIAGVERARLGDGVSIGPFNVFRNLADFECGDDVRVGQWNWFTASGHMRQAGGSATLTLGPQSSITSRHYVHHDRRRAVDPPHPRHLLGDFGSDLRLDRNRRILPVVVERERDPWLSGGRSHRGRDGRDRRRQPCRTGPLRSTTRRSGQGRPHRALLQA
jgi:hypothetical protein